MNIKEDLTTDLKTKMGTEFGKISGGGVEQMMAQNGFLNSLGENKKKKKMKKTESKESTGAGSAGGFEGALFSTTKKEMKEMKETSFKAPKLTMFSDEAPKPVKENKDLEEKWSEKYKRSIDCNHPKGFSQRAHCQGKSKKVETKEATGASSAGSYVTPAAWAKSTSKKDWRGKSKTQIPGGSFVQVKKKCKKFPYCNQGDIKALNIFENETIKKVIKNISEKHGISENVIKSILSYEYYNSK